jgi:hypothetical protein
MCTVAGWNYTQVNLDMFRKNFSFGQPSDVLRKVSFPLMDQNVCRSSSRSRWDNSGRNDLR